MRDLTVRAATAISRRPATAVAALLLATYVATLAPSVTLWDSGEFLSAVRTLGIPHPPGTPLFIFAARAWASAARALDFTVAVNLGSAIATAVAIALLVRTFASRAGAATTVLAGVTSGTMSAVWQSATETEVYGYALCLAAVMLSLGDRAGRTWSPRHRLLLAYLAGLAVPLHLSALVVGPAAVILSVTDESGALSLRAALVPLAGWLAAVSLGTVSLFPAVAALGVVVAGAVGPGRTPGSRRRDAALAAGLALLGATFVLVMLVRAGHDPGINQGNPVSWDALWDVVGRAQYDVPPLWPRRAPLWLQVGNLVQYADWQVALGLDDAPGASLLRTPVTLAFVALALVGAATHRRTDPRAFRGLSMVMVLATLGVVAVLNLRAGPSYGWGVLPPSALHEARERDYFFALAFACWGIWAGVGLSSIAGRINARAWRGVVWSLALAPMVLNWRQADRRRLPESILARSLGTSLLDAVPSNALLVLAGDNDSYAVWYAQQVGRHRGDVVPVTVSLLGADWYREELRRRHGLLDPSFTEGWRGTAPTLAAIEAGAVRQGRPVATSVALTRADRESLGPSWRFAGVAYLGVPGSSGMAMDTAVITRVRDELARAGLGPGAPPGRDPAARYVQRLLLCPEAAVPRERGSSTVPAGLLESTCNY